jgi:uncharacterized protein YbaR (Trm112 family)
VHILLTDVLTCPRCGPRFGLIVLADRLDDRRVVEGRLGCANCREEFSVRDGVADLRFPRGAPAPVAGAAPRDAESALRLAALLGVRDRPGMVLLLGVDADTAEEVARLLPGAQVIVAGEDGGTGARALSRVRLAGSLPFRDASLRGAVVGGEPAPELLDELSRALAPGAHLVVDPAASGTAQTLVDRGLGVVLDQEGVVVASPMPPR